MKLLILIVSILLALGMLTVSSFAQDGSFGGIGAGVSVGGIGGGIGVGVSGTVGAAPPPPTGALVQTDGASFVLQTDNVSHICLSGAAC